MELCVYDRRQKKLITARDKEAQHISIGLTGKITWDDKDVSHVFDILVFEGKEDCLRRNKMCNQGGNDEY